jgi:hypothetical protein
MVELASWRYNTSGKVRAPPTKGSSSTLDSSLPLFPELSDESSEEEADDKKGVQPAAPAEENLVETDAVGAE